MKSIVIVGANGFLGRVLSRHFLDRGWKVLGIARKNLGCLPGVEYVHWDGKTQGAWCEALEWVDVLVNLSGRSVNCRYGVKNRNEVLESRVLTTQLLDRAVRDCKNPPKVWLNSSTATIYRHAEDCPQGDDGDIGAGFSVEVAKAWEAAFFEHDGTQTRKVALRTAIVMGEEENTVWRVMQKLARLGLGGRMGTGRQMVSWISDADFARGVEFLAEKDDVAGTYNLSAPEPLKNRELMRCVRQSVGTKFGLPASQWMLEIGAFFMRTETELILKSRWVLPTRLLAEGFTHQHPSFEKWRDREDG